MVWSYLPSLNYHATLFEVSTTGCWKKRYLAKLWDHFHERFVLTNDGCTFYLKIKSIQHISVKAPQNNKHSLQQSKFINVSSGTCNMLSSRTTLCSNRHHWARVLRLEKLLSQFLDKPMTLEGRDISDGIFLTNDNKHLPLWDFLIRNLTTIKTLCLFDHTLFKELNC